MAGYECAIENKNKCASYLLCSTGNVILHGNFGNGSIATSGTGQVALVGNVTGLVKIKAKGTSTVFVDGTPCK